MAGVAHRIMICSHWILPTENCGKFTPQHRPMMDQQQLAAWLTTGAKNRPLTSAHYTRSGLSRDMMLYKTPVMFKRLLLDIVEMSMTVKVCCWVVQNRMMQPTCG